MSGVELREVGEQPFLQLFGVDQDRSLLQCLGFLQPGVLVDDVVAMGCRVAGAQIHTPYRVGGIDGADGSAVEASGHLVRP